MGPRVNVLKVRTLKVITFSNARNFRNNVSEIMLLFETFKKVAFTMTQNIQVDTVIHEALCLKLVENGISCKYIRILQSLYGKVLVAVKIQSDVSSFFEIALGVKQGEPLSPLLFILFINDVYSDLKNADNGGEITGISINHICFFLLLFADDMILFTKTPTELQILLNKLQKYSTEWGLRVNTKKTKICIFENRRSQQNQLWY